MTKGERREAKRLGERHRIRRHGGSLATIYANAVNKRIAKQEKK